MSYNPINKIEKYPHLDKEKITYEFFKTPKEPINALLDNLGLDLSDCTTVLDIGAGSGNIGRLIKDRCNCIIDSIEIRASELENLQPHSNNVWIEDFLQWTPPKDYQPNLIISNPPFSKSIEIAEHCFRLFPDTPLIMLQRLDWLSSKKRKPFFEQYPISALWCLSQRPCFLESSRQRDIWSYAWFIWGVDGGSIRSV